MKLHSRDVDPARGSSPRHHRCFHVLLKLGQVDVKQSVWQPGDGPIVSRQRQHARPQQLRPRAAHVQVSRRILCPRPPLGLIDEGKDAMPL